MKGEEAESVQGDSSESDCDHDSESEQAEASNQISEYASTVQRLQHVQPEGILGLRGEAVWRRDVEREQLHEHR